MKIDTQNKANHFRAQSVADTHAIGHQLATLLYFPCCVYLDGDLGAGKTTLTKSIIQAFGYLGEVTSPTYNLIQEYQVEQGTIFHMDLYRLTDPSELEYLAIEDLWSKSSLFLIEWPEKGAPYLQTANASISINQGRDGKPEERNIVFEKINMV